MEVKSYTEWQPLEEIIVGSIFNVRTPTFDPSFRLFFNDNFADGYFFADDEFDLPNKFVEEGCEDLEEYANILRKEGIIVRRPEIVKSAEPVIFNTPYNWRGYLTPALNVRDQTMIYGSKIIETPPLIRTRSYENDLLKPLFYEYMRKGATWICAPRPMMTDKSFDLSYLQQQNSPNIPDLKPSPYDIGFEMMIDAAQCIRFGQDIVVNTANANHRLGLQWLRSVLPDVRFHEISIADSHIDGRLVPLAPGKLLIDARRIPTKDMLPLVLQKWDIIPVTKDDLSEEAYEYEDISLASIAIDINVLSLDEKKVVVNAAAKGVIKLLEKHGFTPVPVRFRHGRVLGGAFHCVTLDIRRKGECERFLD